MLTDKQAEETEEKIPQKQKELQMVEDLSSFKKSLAATSGDSQETPIVTLINKILIKALTTESSEIHIEPQKDQLMVRFCQDGGMRSVFDPFPQGITSAVVSRLKVMADLDINQRDICQKGRIEKTFSDRTVEFLVTTLPNLYGEKVMLQVLTPLISQSHQNTAMKSSSAHLAYRLQELERLLKALTYEFQQLKEDLIAQSIPTASDPLIDEEISNARDWAARKQDLEADQMTVTSESSIYEELTDPGDWEQLRRALESDKATIVSESLPDKKLPDPW